MKPLTTSELIQNAGYARHKRTGEVGDIEQLGDKKVSVTIYGSREGGIRRTTWSRRMVELIEFGSFNENSKNYVAGGKVIG